MVVMVMVMVVMVMVMMALSNSLMTPGDFTVPSALVVDASDWTGRHDPSDCDGELQQYLDGLDLTSELHCSPALHLLLVEETN